MSLDALEVERQIQCAANRIRELAYSRKKGSITIHFDGSGNIGKFFVEQFSTCRDVFSPTRMGKQVDED